MVHDPGKIVRLRDGKGGHAVIKYKTPDEPNQRLGYRICPNGNQVPHHEATLNAIRDLTNACAGSYLTEREARQALFQRYSQN